MTVQQNKRILHMISKDYKEIESYIYEYAVYLQANELANNPSYEPKPFFKIEELMGEEMKGLNRTLMSSKEDSEVKGKLMRDFVLRTMDHYRRKVLLCLCRTRR